MVKVNSHPRESVWTKGQPKEKVVRTLPQVNNTTPANKPRDAARRARLPGKRVSKNGNVYWETRSNRSDKRPNAVVGKKL